MDVRFVDIDTCSDAGGVVVVIDVLRAFSTAAYWLAGGVVEIWLAGSKEEAYELGDREPGALLLTDSHPLPAGFELTNSPVHATERDLAGRRIVQRTAAGTLGASRCVGAATLLCASFVVAGATSRLIRTLRPAEVTFVVTGGDEDRACAEYLAGLLHGRGEPHSYLERVRRSRAALAFQGVEGPGVHELDVDYCCQLDRFGFAMQVSRRDGVLALTRVDAG
jgi:2-phosphosulfolactate phosphatase